MEIKLTKEESEKFFYNALCNCPGFGGYGLEFIYNDSDYNKAKKTLQKKLDNGKVPVDMDGSNLRICIENVQMEILRNGGKLKMIDIEGEGEYTREIGLKEVHERVQKTPVRHLTDMIEENDDADTADVIIQTVFFESVIFA